MCDFFLLILNITFHKIKVFRKLELIDIIKMEVYMKKFTRIMLAFLLSLTLVGCTTETKVEKDFTAFIEELPKELMGDNGFDLNFYFYNAKAYGFEKTSEGIAISSVEEIEESYSEYQDLLDTLNKYDYDTLTKQQQQDYDVLQEYLERTLLLKDYIYFDHTFLGSFVGFQAQLPLLLMEFSFNDQEDVSIYLDCLKKAPADFKEMVKIEKQRQKEGTGMSKRLLDGVIEQASTFSTGDYEFLITSFNEKIEQVDFLTQEQKEEAKQKNEKFVVEGLLFAYALLADELNTITPKQKDGGIYGRDEADDYYVALYQNKLGLSFTIDELKEYIDNKEEETLTKISDFIFKNPELQDFSYEDIAYDNFETIEENINYLASVYSQYYPKVDAIDFVAKVVPDSMKSNFSPAAYLTSRIDRTIEPLMVIVNGTYEPSLFDTVAHEGYPGHMYQDVYFKKQDVSTFRYLLDCNGYSEGWATYAEKNSYRFVQSTDKKMLELRGYLVDLTKLAYCKWDIAINYEGMTRKEFKEDIETNFGEAALGPKELEEMYSTFMETPTNYLQYYITGFYFQDLYDKAKKELGSKFDEVDFHKVILDVGLVGMELVEKYVDQYIQDTK